MDFAETSNLATLKIGKRILLFECDDSTLPLG